MTETQDFYLARCFEAAHEANRIYCAAIGDPPTQSWAELDEAQIFSGRAAVRAVLAGNSPEESHALWSRARLDQGWKYGPVKDFDKKEHPNLVPYDDLPPEQKAKDRLFITVVAAMARALDLQV